MRETKEASKHSKNRQLLQLAKLGLLPLSMASLSSCAPVFKENEQLSKQYYRSLPRCVLNSDKPSRQSQLSMAKMRRSGQTLAHTPEERIAVAEYRIRSAQHDYLYTNDKVVEFYLKAGESLWPILDQSLAADDKQFQLAKNLYREAVSQTVDRLAHQKQLPTDGKSVTVGSYTLNEYSGHRPTLRPDYFDNYIPSQKTSHLFMRSDVHFDGYGAPMVGQRFYAEDRLAEDPFMPDIGLHVPINALIEFKAGGKASIAITNLRDEEEISWRGKTYPLTADYTTALAASFSHVGNLSTGLDAAINGEKYLEREGLYSGTPYSEGKIPIVFIHGLISSPAAWANTVNEVMADPLLRKNFQAYYFFYPTGQPPALPSGHLRMELQRLQAYCRSRGDHEASQNMVLIGHSMGGLVANAQIRRFDKKLWQKLSDISLEEFRSHSDAEAMEKVQAFFNPPSIDAASRVIFIATPHRGSKLASDWLGRTASQIIAVPKDVLTLQMDSLREDLNEIGQAITAADEKPTSITKLKPNNPYLKTLLQQPLNPEVKYHSIIGNRGRKGPLAKASDGVVTYRSSRLDGAESELILPFDHQVHDKLETSEEIQRILHKHLKSLGRE
ncbi:esterase/lipase family protein [Persicirhabdus sediminis]|uniref:AB hydrolase-1 domain-containing protein n=1 Tax=Persicirhabdus sediminis TaxID=454144 RepID=A0A8J7SNJ3_9BACT|nr:hypothetical protein [Persicirhabdus sediminis]MBK1791718.1 hypothetical protein [Persicirhabdus sediminis]